MTRNFPLLDGSVIDLDRTPLPALTRDGAEARDSTVLETDFSEAKNPSWLDFAAEGGGVQTFSGLGEGKATTTLSTGTANNDDVSKLIGPTINYGNWSEIRISVNGILPSSIDGKGAFISFANSTKRNPDNAMFYSLFGSNGDVHIDAYNAGVKQRVTPEQKYADQTTPASLGIHSYDHGNGGGHTADVHYRGEHYDSFSEGIHLPPPQKMTLTISIWTTDTTADRKLELSGIRIELVP